MMTVPPEACHACFESRPCDKHPDPRAAIAARWAAGTQTDADVCPWCLGDKGCSLPRLHEGHVGGERCLFTRPIGPPLPDVLVGADIAKLMALRVEEARTLPARFEEVAQLLAVRNEEVARLRALVTETPFVDWCPWCERAKGQHHTYDCRMIIVLNSGPVI